MNQHIFPKPMTAVVLLVAVACGVGMWHYLTQPETVPPVVAKPISSAGPLSRLELENAPTASPIRFSEVSEESGIHFVYYGNPSREHYMTEQNGGGVALLDYDGDDYLDIFLANGSHFDRPAEQAAASHKLYRAEGDLRYRDVTRAAGLESFGFGMGCAAGDYDNDGFTDLFLAGYGRNWLWHNNGDGTFSEVALDAAAESQLWGTSAAFADLDGDGNLDLYVVNYVAYGRDDPPCYTQHQPPVRISCGPLGRRGQADLLYHNLGDGRFEDVSRQSGIGVVEGKGLGVTIADFDEDGRLDVYVANDTTENLLFRNLGQMRFEEVGLTQGVAVGSEGVARSGMGIGCADSGGDGRFDLLVTNFQNEPNDFYENLGASGFRARNTEMGLDAVSRPVLGFGVVFADFDLDRHPDLFVTNGHVWDLRSLELGYSYEMPPHLLRNDAGRRFLNVSAFAGDYFQNHWLGRAAAVGDLDNDGDADLLVTHLIQPAALLRNDSTLAGRSVRLRLIGTRSARQPLGARVEMVVAGTRITRRCPAGDSFQASSDPRIILSVEQAQSIDQLRVHWPGGRVEVWNDLKTESTITLFQRRRRPSILTRDIPGLRRSQAEPGVSVDVLADKGHSAVEK